MVDDVRFLSYFAGRTDVFARQQPDGSYRPVYETLGPEHLQQQRDGTATYGIYTVRADETTKMLVWDIDTGKLGDAERIVDTLELLGVDNDQVWVEFSGRKGYHVWCFLDDWRPADIAFKAARAVLQQAKMEGTEAYPKQQRVRGLSRGVGNLIKLPFTIHLGSGQRSHAVPPGRTWAVRRLSFTQLTDLADEYVEPAYTASADGPPEEGWVKKLPCIVRIEAGVGKGKRDFSMYTLARDCRRRGLDESQTVLECMEANQSFRPPMTPGEVLAKVTSAFSGPNIGVQCSQSFLHDREDTLCSKRCPRYPAIEGMPATDDAPPGSAGSGVNVPITSYKVGDLMQVLVRKVSTRRDGATVLVLAYDDQEAVMVLKEDTT